MNRQQDNKFIGVRKEPDSIKFFARIAFEKKRIHLGTFDSDIKAAKAYDEAVDKYYPGGMRNFPKSDEKR